jgi:hypothetical protein
VPPEALAFALTTYVVPREELTQDTPVGEATNVVTLLGDLRHLEPAHPGALEPVAHVHLRPRRQGHPPARLAGVPRHDPIVLSRR